MIGLGIVLRLHSPHAKLILKVWRHEADTVGDHGDGIGERSSSLSLLDLLNCFPKKSNNPVDAHGVLGDCSELSINDGLELLLSGALQGVVRHLQNYLNR